MGVRAIRARRASKRSSRASGGADSTARPQAAASLPLRQSPVKRRRLAFSTPMRWAHNAEVGTPQTRAGLNLVAGGTAFTNTLFTAAGPETQIDTTLGNAASLRWPKFGNKCTLVNGNAQGVNQNVNSLKQTMTIAAGEYSKPNSPSGPERDSARYTTTPTTTGESATDAGSSTDPLPGTSTGPALPGTSTGPDATTTGLPDTTTGLPDTTTGPDTGRPMCDDFLEARIRDFKSSHPDFEKFGGDLKGIVKVDLGPDKKPVYAAAGTNPYYGNRDALGDFLGQMRRDFLKHNRKTTQLFKQFRVF